MKFKAKWTGEYPSLCIGEWKLYRKYEDYLDDGTKDIRYDDISNLIPENFKYEPMYTLGVYSSWYFDSDYIEQFKDYTDGLDFEEWCKDNESWIYLICESEDYRDLYEAFNKHDWRYESCGGCI